jgi:hypothetical protein
MAVQEQQYQELAGDPDHLQTMAQHYLDIANAIKHSVTALDAIRDNDQQSKATDALGPAAGDLATDIERAENRYRVTAQALLDYVPHLRSAKSDAHTAVVNIQHWSEQVSSTSTALDHANDAVDDASDDDKDGAKTQQTTAQNNASNAKEHLHHWQEQWTAAANARNTAAETARGKITDVVEHHNNGLKNPTHHWWDGVVDFVKSAGKWVWDHLDEISNWLGIAALLLSWVPGLGQILLIATLAVGALKLIKDIAEGKGWKAILGDVVGLALTALAGPAGKYLAKVGKFAAMERAMGGTSNAAARALSSNGTRLAAFESKFGVKPYQFAKFAAGKENVLNNAAKPGMSTFLKEVRTPFKFEMKPIGTEFSNFVKNPLGLNFAKLGQDVSFTQGADVFKQLSNMDKIGLLAVDGRKVLSTTQSLTNLGMNFSHGDFALKGDQVPQAAMTPEKLVLKAIP